MTRYVTTTTELASTTTTSWEGAVNEDDDHLPGNDALAIENGTLQGAREKQCRVRMSSGYCHQQHRNENASSTAVRIGVYSVQKKTTETRREEGRNDSPCGVQRDGYGCAHRHEVTRKALIDFGATRSMVSWEALDGLARMNEQRHIQLVFPLIAQRRRGSLLQMEKDDTAKEKSHSRYTLEVERATAEPILWSVKSLSQIGTIIASCTGAAFFRTLRDQTLNQREREPHGHLYVSLVEDVHSQPILDKGQLQGFQAAARVLEHLDK